MRLDAEEIRQYLHARRLGGRIDCLDDTESTNTDVASAARTGAAEGLVIIADGQSRGRGRLGRVWSSPPGANLYCSVLLRPEMAPEDVPLLTLTAGVAVADAIEAHAGERVAIKWPNDVLLRGRKVAGILTEMEAAGGKPVFVVVGIGVNLNAAESEFPAEVRGLATSIAWATGRKVDRARFAADLLNALDARYESALRDGFSALLPVWSERDALRGRPVQVRVGNELVSGVGAGLAANGRLQLDTEAGRREIVAGDVSLVGAYRQGTSPE